MQATPSISGSGRLSYADIAKMNLDPSRTVNALPVIDNVDLHENNVSPDNPVLNDPKQILDIMLNLFKNHNGALPTSFVESQAKDFEIQRLRKQIKSLTGEVGKSNEIKNEAHKMRSQNARLKEELDKYKQSQKVNSIIIADQQQKICDIKNTQTYVNQKKALKAQKAGIEAKREQAENEFQAHCARIEQVKSQLKIELRDQVKIVKDEISEFEVRKADFERKLKEKKPLKETSASVEGIFHNIKSLDESLTRQEDTANWTNQNLKAHQLNVEQINNQVDLATTEVSKAIPRFNKVHEKNNLREKFIPQWTEIACLSDKLKLKNDYLERKGMQNSLMTKLDALLEQINKSALSICDEKENYKVFPGINYSFVSGYYVSANEVEKFNSALTATKNVSSTYWKESSACEKNIDLLLSKFKEIEKNDAEAFKRAGDDPAQSINILKGYKENRKEIAQADEKLFTDLVNKWNELRQSYNKLDMKIAILEAAQKAPGMNIPNEKMVSFEENRNLLTTEFPSYSATIAKKQ